MSITTYTELQAAVSSWLHRSDLGAVLPDFITLTEEKFNRRLRVRQMELALAPAFITDDLVTIPANVVGVKSLWLSGYEATPLKAQSLEHVVASDRNGLATAYAWQGATWRFNGTGTAVGVLYRTVPPLASNATNWLLTLAPSAYLFGALSESFIWAKDPEAAQWASRCDQILDEISGNDKRDTYSGPLVSRAR